MLDKLRGHLDGVKRMADGASFVLRILSRTELLSALSPAGVARFARNARGIKPGPHATVILHAHNKPDKTAIVHGSRRISYAALNREINQIAHALLDAGVTAGDRVAIMLPNCPEHLMIQQAMGRIGTAAVEIGYRLKAPEIAYVLDNSEPRAIFVHADYAPQMRAALEQIDAQSGASGGGAVFTVGTSALASTGGTDGGGVLGQRYTDALARFEHAADTTPRSGEVGGSVIVYTSGTTGKPKGATRDLRRTGLEAIGDFLQQVRMRPGDRQLIVCPLYHSAAPAFAAMLFALGGTVVILDHFEPEQVLAAIERERITCAFCVPTQLIRLGALPESTRAGYDTSSLRWVLSGAAPLATETARRFQDAYGDILWNFYGATETGMVTLAGPPDHTARPGTIGRALRGNEIRLLGEDGGEVATGEVGELYARNSMLITGYHKNRDATDRSMREGFFSVGDMARVDEDGFYYLESRKHDLVISGGVNIYPREIEDHLHTHPDILEAAVIGVPDDDWGESLKAFVVARPGSALTETDVVQFCREGLADFKRPRAVEFMDDLPHNPTGKVLKRELRDR